MDHIINYFEHHYDFKVISATFKSRPSKFVKHFGNALMAVIAVHSKSNSSPLDCFYLAYIGTVVRRPDCDCILQNRSH